MSYVYAISEGLQGPVKIGVSNNPANRLRELQIGNGRPLEIAAVWRFADRSTAFEVEHTLQDELAEFAMCGEWLDLGEHFIFDYMPNFLLSIGIEEEPCA